MGAWIAAAAFTVLAATFAENALAQATSIKDTKHNLGTTGTQTIHATSGTDEVCVFCHTPHGGVNGSAPLWNKGLPTPAVYQLYGSTGGESATLDGQVLAVGSVSQACLSCHDGTQAMDNFINAPGSGGYNASGASAGYSWTVGTGLMPDGVTKLGEDLRNDHPIGVQYCGGGITDNAGAQAGTCKDPDFNAPTSSSINTLLQFWVDSAGGTTGTREKTDMILYRRTFTAGGSAVGPSVECGSCHDPHNYSNPTFLRIANTGSNLCLSCHKK